ncbi:MAG: aminodeoxychorismate synthase component I [Acidobacteriota bacterium]
MLELAASLAPAGGSRLADVDWVDPLEALGAQRGRRHPVLLLSGLRGHPASRFSILSWDPVLVATYRAGRARLVRADEDGEAVVWEGRVDPFDLVRTIAPARRVARLAGLPFAGGAVGYLGYGLRRAVETLPASAADPLGLPEAWLGVYDAALVFDHAEGRVAALSTGLSAGSARAREERAGRRLTEFVAALGPLRGRRPRVGARRPVGGIGAALVTRRSEYLERVGRALRYIAAGDIYQVNLSHRIVCPFSGDPVTLFADLARRSPSPFSAYLDAGSFQVVSASPERFLSLRDGRATSAPIKGTRPRGGTAEEDGRLARELLSSAKDRAENIMIADLVRNDLGRVCEPGSVRAERLCALESFATVHHLVSTISGRPRAGRDRVDLLRALFPAGSMTGAPKVRAMEVIDELEGEERGVYSGCVGYLSLDGSMDFSVVIRTVLCAGGRAHLRVGGGIVADSDPEMEHRETLDKARALLDVLRAAL